MKILGQTHKGIKRQINQDSFIVSEKPEQCWAVVCDGVGGSKGGEVASKLTCEIIGASFSRSITSNLVQQSIENVIMSAVASANAEVYHRNVIDNTSMGTTLVGAVVQNGLATIFWAGDSRVYLLRNDILTQITTDHTIVQQLVDMGKITKQQAEQHPERNRITKAIGIESSIRAEFYIHTLNEGDSLLLCSDGVYNYINHHHLESLTAVCIAKGNITPIIDNANMGGGGDNITAVILSPKAAYEAVV